MSTINAGRAHREVISRGTLTPREFYADYVGRQPVVMRGALAGLPAVSRWSVEYLRALAPDLRVRLKTGNLSEGATTTATLTEYAATVAGLVARHAAGDPPGELPPYLHDLPLLALMPGLRADLDPFPARYFPRFFRPRWPEFTQFFVSPPGACTPFHFDTLQTHNLFFQVHGDKRFVLVAARDRPDCYTYNWRWASVDPENPDYERFPRFQGVTTFECVLHAGDILYLPPGTLHQVKSLSASISFNIDWHDKASALRGMLAVRDGMPVRNLQYNAAFALGVLTGIPFRWLRPALASYYYYIS